MSSVKKKIQKIYELSILVMKLKLNIVKLKYVKIREK